VCGQVAAGSTSCARAASALNAGIDIVTVERKQDETTQNTFEQDHANAKGLFANRLGVTR